MYSRCDPVGNFVNLFFGDMAKKRFPIEQSKNNDATASNARVTPETFGAFAHR